LTDPAQELNAAARLAEGRRLNLVGSLLKLIKVQPTTPIEA
jgi:hypothetical protein